MSDLVERLTVKDAYDLGVPLDEISLRYARMQTCQPSVNETQVTINDAILEALVPVAAELSRLSALVAWQDIETAPRDGTPIIGAFWTIRWADSHRRGDIVRCWYQPEFGAFISSAREMTLAPGLTFEDGTSRQIHSPVIEPVTHWMHLHPFTAAKEG